MLTLDKKKKSGKCAIVGECACVQGGGLFRGTSEKESDNGNKVCLFRMLRKIEYPPHPTQIVP